MSLFLYDTLDDRVGDLDVKSIPFGLDQQAAVDTSLADGALRETREAIVMMLDPQADPGRRAWLPCAYCGDNSALYLLDSDVWMIWVQCGKCLRRWWHDTSAGRGRHGEHHVDVA